MIIIPPEMIKSKGDTIQLFLADQDKFETFYRDFVLTSKAPSTNVSGKDTRVTQDMRPQRISRTAGLSPVSSLQSFLLSVGLDRRGAQEVLEIMLRDQYRCEMRNFVAPHG